LSGTKLSIVIPTLNEEENLGQCVKSLANQTMQDFEVIIADGGSADQTVDIGEENGFTVLMVEKTRPHDVSTAKNLGAKYAVGDILFFLDADMILEPNCFEVLSEGYEASDVVGIALKVLPSEANRLEKAMYECNNYLARIGNKIGIHEISYFSCHSYLRDPFMWVGGFRMDLLACEDLDLSLRLRRLGRYIVTPRTVIWTSPRRLRAWSNHGYLYRYVRYLTEYYLYDRVSNYYDDL
jgi:glycosyltransferase involved in cell wall biosynthesis